MGLPSLLGELYLGRRALSSGRYSAQLIAEGIVTPADVQDLSDKVCCTFLIWQVIGEMNRTLESRTFLISCTFLIWQVIGEMNRMLEESRTYTPRKSDWLASNWAGMLPPNIEGKFIGTGVEAETLSKVGGTPSHLHLPSDL